MFFVKEHFVSEWHTIILQQFINEARLYNIDAIVTE